MLSHSLQLWREFFWCTSLRFEISLEKTSQPLSFVCWKPLQFNLNGNFFVINKMDSGFYLQLPDSPERSEKLWVLKEKYGAIWWKLFDKILSLHYKGTSPRDNVKYYGQGIIKPNTKFILCNRWMAREFSPV